jgi:pyridoxal phosphate enzyme (YggS family)
MGMTVIGEHLEQLEAAIEAACRAANRRREEIELMAVSKTHPAEAIAEAYALGITLFGENRVQEFAAKAPRLEALRSPREKRARVHLIGHLQSNKAARAAEIFDGFDALDSLRLAERLNEAAGKLGKRLPVLIEVKLSTEETKTGVIPESAEAARLLERLPDFGNLEMRGLMTIAPFDVADEVTRTCFRRLRELRELWAAAHARLAFDVLSMGMSGDFALAIAEGATRIRIGTAIFGSRQTGQA